jgi:Nif-specific regulatory protein
MNEAAACFHLNFRNPNSNGCARLQIEETSGEIDENLFTKRYRSILKDTQGFTTKLEEMQPTLAAISGPLKGKAIVIDTDEWSIGRGESNHLHLHDKSASRNHCLIKRNQDHFTIEDLESKNGTFIENVPVKSHTLKHGETVRIGDSVFVFLLRDEDLDSSLNPIQLESENLKSQSTIRLRHDESVYLHPEKLRLILPAGLRTAQDLNTLLKLSTEIVSIGSQTILFHRFLELVFEAIPAEHGAVILRESGKKEFSQLSSLQRSQTKNSSGTINEAIVNQVINDGSGILCNDILDSNVTSLLCAPIHPQQTIFGVIYLDTSDLHAPFDEAHLQLLTAMSAMLSMSLQNLLNKEKLSNENQRLRQEIQFQHPMVGESGAMKEIYRSIQKIAPADCTVLIFGETGTGKELVARALHNNSSRAEKPFIAINCAALTETLLESELFGHEKGAFTGAIALKKGKIELADSGTLFLDEVAELSPPLQAKLLRVLQEREFERVGGLRSIRVDVRLIAATNKDLKQAVSDGKFRDDLFFRLNVVSVRMPSLRDRKEDISLLANYFISKYSKQFKKRVDGISSEAKAYLERYSWPGNVRELENAIERAIVLGSTDFVLPEDLPESILESGPPAGVSVGKYQDAILDAKRQVILKAVEQAKGNYAEAAKILGVQRTYLHRVMRNLKLKGE